MINSAPSSCCMIILLLKEAAILEESVMAIKDIQVYVDNDLSCKQRVEVAVNVATTINAHLTGIHIRLPTDSDAAEVNYKTQDERESKARDIFDEVTAQGNVKVDWRSVPGHLAYHLANTAHYTDLLVLSQPNPKDALTLNHGIADEVVLSAGCPCLLVPYDYSDISFGKSPLVAWDGSREASRAVKDALPFLKKASTVTILLVEPERADPNFGDLPGAVISEYLARHNIKVAVEISKSNQKEIGDTILTYANSEHDLLVMGAYGHARWREVALGGVTRTVMENMKVPTLMSH